MDYKVYTPSDALSKQVRYYWSLESGDDVQAPESHRIFPDGCIELIFHYSGLFRTYDEINNAQTQPLSFVHGQLTSFIEVESTGVIGIFSVRFNPAGLKPFTDTPVQDFTDISVDVREIWGEDGTLLEKEMLGAANNEERVVIIESFLLKKLEAVSFDNSDVEYCVDAMLKSEGTVSIDKLADELEIGKRQLERKFIAAVGLSPKMLARIIRFQNTLQLIEKKEFTNFTNVAYDGGFYDQAHFIKDFKEFTGLNPKQYFSENLEMVKHFTFE
ncbi:helix-turn-helix domain-containing protein [Flavobacterium sp. DGU11]|uniref:Helix-turn-helix domain-containing protein n=1 Tax=Flavobacterium arundinis TaxID=3139143 RepID=A0ABU9HY44_9FLAO